MEDEETTIKCSQEFMNIISDFQKRFEDKYMIKPSAREVTKIIAAKIEKVGGLIV